jgi:TonB family protein
MSLFEKRTRSAVAASAALSTAGRALKSACWVAVLALGTQVLRAQAKPDDVPPPFIYDSGQFGEHISPPRLIHSVYPKYTQAARRAKYQGVCVVSLVVDEQGVPKDVHVPGPLGMGLEKSAVDAVRQYRFQPATYNGKPVAVRMTVKVSFKFTESPDKELQSPLVRTGGETTLM